MIGALAGLLGAWMGSRATRSVARRDELVRAHAECIAALMELEAARTEQEADKAHSLWRAKMALVRVLDPRIAMEAGMAGYHAYCLAQLAIQDSEDKDRADRAHAGIEEYVRAVLHRYGDRRGRLAVGTRWRARSARMNVVAWARDIGGLLSRLLKALLAGLVSRLRR